MTGHRAARSGLEWRDGSGYEAYVGRWSRQVASDFVDWLAVVRHSRWIDVGCGTGALSETVLARTEPASVHGLDPAEEYVAVANAANVDPRVAFSVGDATTLPFADGSVDVVVSGLVLNFIEDAAAALAEQTRVVRPGGTIGAYIWDYHDGLEFIRSFWQAAIAVEPDAVDFERRADFRISTAGALERLLSDAGLRGVAVGVFEVETTFGSFDELWGPFLGGTRLGPGQDPVWKGPSHELLVSLDEATRDEIRDDYRRRLPKGTDGSVRLAARALAIKGSRPD